ncbi:MAG: peptidylprolyl isomerase [Alphaproteobacteria bacterium]
MARLALSAVVLAAMLFASPLPDGAVVRHAAAQQDVMRIAAIVNDDIISIFDLAIRLQIAIRSSGFEDSVQLRRQLAPQVLRAMVDERLQAQEAKRLNVTASAEEIAAAKAQVESQNNWGEGSFDNRILAAGLDLGSVVEQLQTSVVWAKLVRRRFGITATVSEEEIDAAAAQFTASQGQRETRVAEIFLPLDDPDQETLVRGTANDLVNELRGGAAFPAVARQFSKGATADQGGEIGWVAPGQLAPELDAAIVGLSPGEISDPIRTFDGYYILTVIAREARDGGAGETNPTVSLAQVVIDPALGSAAADALIGELRQASDCAGFLAAAKGRSAPTSGELGSLALNDLPAELRTVVTPLRKGEVSQPLPFEGTRRLLMVCERAEPETATATARTSVDREAIRRDLGNRKLDLASRRYLRDLRRTAFIELRI